MIKTYLSIVYLLPLLIFSSCTSLQLRSEYKNHIPLEAETFEELNGIYALTDTTDALKAEKYHTFWRDVTDGSSGDLPIPDALGISALSANEIQLILFRQNKVLDTYVLEGSTRLGIFNSKTDRDYSHISHAIFMYNTDTFHIIRLPESEVIIRHYNPFAFLLLGVISVGNNNDSRTYQLSRISSLQ